MPVGQLRFRFLGGRAAQPNELKGHPPAVAMRADEAQCQKAQQKAVPIAEKEKRKPSAHMNSVDIALDGYDDIFSDFDPSPYRIRLLSEDFIKEITRRHRETKGGDLEVRLTLPKGRRNAVVENIIRERLGEYFGGKAQKAEEEIRARERKGWKYMAAGIALNVVGILVVHFMEGANVAFKVGGSLVEMAGWISTWVGAERAIMETPKEMREQKEFYERMAKAVFVFISEEDIVRRIEKTSADAGKKEERPKEKRSAEPTASGAPAAEAASPPGPAAAGAGGEPSG